MMKPRYGISDDGELRLDDAQPGGITTEVVDFVGGDLFVLGAIQRVTYAHPHPHTAGVEVKLSLVNCRDLRDALTRYLDSEAGLS